MAAQPEVGVIGLRALNRDLNRLVDDRGPINKLFREAGKRAVEPVAEAARSALPHTSGTLAGDVRTSGTRTGATVRMGRSAVPYAGAVEFGGWPGDRAYLPNGRYLFPAARGLASTTADLYAKALQDAFDNFDWSNVTTDGDKVHD